MGRVPASVLTLIASCVFAAPAGASFPGANGGIAYTGPEQRLHIVLPGSEEPTEITNSFALNPAFNADGTKIAFGGRTLSRDIDDPGCDPDEEECRGAHELYVMNADGSGLHAVTDTRGFEAAPSWNPAGTQLVFEDAEDNTLKILDLASGEMDVLYSECCPAFADWSPTGELIAFEQDPAGLGVREIWTIEPDGENPRRLTATGPSIYNRYPSWSPDGTRIAFARGGNEGPIYTVPADSVDGSGEELVASGPFFSPTYSPDGQTIAFSKLNPDGDSTDLASAPASGGITTVMPVSPATGFHDEWMGAWQPIPVLESVEEEAPAGGTVDTGESSTPEDAVQAAVTTPNAGTILIQQIEPVATPPAGFGLLGTEFRIEAPDASAEEPLSFAFILDASLIPAGETFETIRLMRDGEVVPACTGASGVAIPDPCVSARVSLPDGDASITALSSHASAWNLLTRDDDPPKTRITAGPRGQTTQRKPEFEFTSSEERSTFKCRVDSKPFRRCTSPYAKKLSYGTHKFEVVAIDEAQNKDASPAKRSFKVVR